jgi:hypothetical protein
VTLDQAPVVIESAPVAKVVPSIGRCDRQGRNECKLMTCIY